MLQDAHHAHSNEDLLKKKVQSIVECYLESTSPPTLQVISDIALKIQQFTATQFSFVLDVYDISPLSNHLPLVISFSLVFSGRT